MPAGDTLIAEVDRFSGKIVGLLGLGVFASWIFGYEFRVWFASPTGGEFVALAILAACFLTVFVITMFALKGMQVMAAGAFLQVVAIWASLEGKFSGFTLAGLAALFIFMLIGFARGRTDITNSLKVRFFRTSYRSVAVTTTGLVLFITVYFLGSANVSQENFHRGVVDFLVRTSEPMIKEAVPGFSASKTVDEVLRAFIMANLPPGATQADIETNLHNMKTEIIEATNFRLIGNEKFSDALYSITTAKILALPSAYRIFTLVLIGLTLFGLVKGVAIVLNIVVVFLAFIAYEILLGLNVFTLRLESANREIIIVD